MTKFTKRKLKENLYNLIICFLGVSIYHGWSNITKIIVSFLITSFIYGLLQFIGIIKTY